MQYAYNEGAPTEGGPYQLITKLTDGARYSGKEEDTRTTKTSYSGQENLGWKLGRPTSVTSSTGAINLTHTILYDASTGNVTETRMPASPGAKSPHDEQTIYYTTAANSEYPACGGHPEWAGLACQTQPGAQPKETSLPPLAISTDTYNIWDEPEKHHHERERDAHNDDELRQRRTGRQHRNDGQHRDRATEDQL